MNNLRPTLLATAIALAYLPAFAQTAAEQPAQQMEAVTVRASADASAGGLAAPFAGGQVARGARTGILGTQDTMNTPFSITSYTHEFIADQQAQSVGDVLTNDAGVRQARGFGNFSELYLLRGFPVFSDDIGYNGLYGMLPRQYIASEFFERVEIVRGANAFLNGAAPGGSSIGGAINLLPKRADNEPLTEVTAGIQSGGQAFVATDISRRFGPDQSTGLRLNAVRRDGQNAIDGEGRELSALGLGLDWHSRDVRLSADLGYQNNRLKDGRPSVTPAADFIPRVPDNKTNYAEPWTYSSEKDVFGTVRAEWDINQQTTAWAAGGLRRGSESNSLAGVTVTNTAGDTTGYRFDNERKDDVATGEVGVRYKFATGPVRHEAVASAAVYAAKERDAYGMGFGIVNNLYNPFASARPDITFPGGDLNNPQTVARTNTHSYALADTLSFAEDRVRLTLGARRQTIAQDSYDYNTQAQTAHYNESATTPVAGLVVKATNSLSVYANYIEALTQGDIAPANTSDGQAVANAGQVFAPYKSKQKEIGVKWDGKNIGATAALYTTDKPVSYVQNQVFGQYGKQRNRGLELNVYGQPMKGLRLLGGATFTQATQEDTEGNINEGKNVIGVPKRLFNLGAEWDVPGVTGLSLNARVLHTSSQYADAANTLEVPSWTRTDIGARYLMNIGNNRLLTLRARVDNLFDRRYWASVGGYPGSNYLVQSTPRTISVSATIDF
jgi:iron complex outermembrane receptor protein